MIAALLSFGTSAFAVEPPSAALSNFTSTVDMYFPVQTGGVVLHHWGMLLDGIYKHYSSVRDFSLKDYKYYYVFPISHYPSGALSRCMVFLSEEPLLDGFYQWVQEYLYYLDQEDVDFYNLSMDPDGMGGYTITGYNSSPFEDIEIKTTYTPIVEAPVSGVFSFEASYIAVAGSTVTYRYISQALANPNIAEYNGIAINNFFNLLLQGAYYPYSTTSTNLTTATDNDVWSVSPGNLINGCVTNQGRPDTFSQSQHVAIENVISNFLRPVNFIGKDSQSWATYFYNFYNPSEDPASLLNAAIGALNTSLTSNTTEFQDIISDIVDSDNIDAAKTLLDQGSGLASNIQDELLAVQAPVLNTYVKFLQLIPYIGALIGICAAIMILKRILQH